MHENKNINVPVRINPVVLNDSSKPSQFQLPDSFLNPFSWINAPSCVTVTQQKPNSQDLTVISSTPCVSCSDATGRWGGQFEISTVLLSAQTLPYLKKPPPPSSSSCSFSLSLSVTLSSCLLPRHTNSFQHTQELHSVAVQNFAPCVISMHFPFKKFKEMNTSIQ